MRKNCSTKKRKKRRKKETRNNGFRFCARKTITITVRRVEASNTRYREKYHFSTLSWRLESKWICDMCTKPGYVALLFIYFFIYLFFFSIFRLVVNLYPKNNHDSRTIVINYRNDKQYILSNRETAQNNNIIDKIYPCRDEVRESHDRFYWEER